MYICTECLYTRILYGLETLNWGGARVWHVCLMLNIIRTYIEYYSAVKKKNKAPVRDVRMRYEVGKCDYAIDV